jgi:hypothetical protein
MGLYFKNGNLWGSKKGPFPPGLDDNSSNVEVMKPEFKLSTVFKLLSVTIPACLFIGLRLFWYYLKSCTVLCLCSGNGLAIPLL